MTKYICNEPCEREYCIHSSPHRLIDGNCKSECHLGKTCKEVHMATKKSAKEVVKKVVKVKVK